MPRRAPSASSWSTSRAEATLLHLLVRYDDPVYGPSTRAFSVEVAEVGGEGPFTARLAYGMPFEASPASEVEVEVRYGMDYMDWDVRRGALYGQWTELRRDEVAIIEEVINE